MKTIELGNVGSKEQADKLVAKLSGKSYFNFMVEYGTFAGNYPVTVSTDYPTATKKAFRNMLMFVLASEL